MVKLSKRLQAIASFVPTNSFVADVGADHGKLGIYLLSNHIASRVQSIENKTGPFVRMKSNFETSGFINQVECSLSDGISELNPKVDTVVLAGIGGLLTNKILLSNEEKLNNVKTIILDPHRDLYEVRKTISELGYAITDEEIVYEDHIYYSIIKFEKCSEKLFYTEEELLFGPVLLSKQDEIFVSYLKDNVKKIEDILKEDIPINKRKYYEQLKERILARL